MTDTTLDEFLECFSARAVVHDRSGEIATESLEDLRKAGYLGLAVPRNIGGQEIPLSDMTRIVAKIATADPSTALILAMQYLQTWAVAQSSWAAPAKDRLLKDILDNGTLINALRVEPELGTPSRGGIPQTVIRKDTNGWRLDGRKIFSTGSTALRWGLVWVATAEESPRIGQILVRLDEPGVRIEKSWHQLGMRATGSHTFIFDNVFIPDDHIINVVSPSVSNPEIPQLGRYHALLISSLYNAIACSARDWFVKFLHERVPSGLGRSLATLPRFHVVIGELEGLLLSNKALLQSGFTENISEVEIQQVKRLVTENAISAVTRAIEAIGNPGLSQNNPLERHFRDVLCGRIHSPQGDAVLESAGRDVLMPSTR